jgi:hypothetical protein
MELEANIVDHDPWDTVLYPAEPQPEYYATFEGNIIIYSTLILQTILLC